jgi:hypothetical protein
MVARMSDGTLAPRRHRNPKGIGPKVSRHIRLAVLLGTGVAGQNRHDLLQHRFGSGAELLAGQMTDGVLGENDRIVWGTPHAGHRPRRFGENIRTDGHGRNASFFNMNTIVHTARAARPSTANGHDRIVTRLSQLLNHLRSRRLGG